MKIFVLLILITTTFSQRYAPRHDNDDCRYCEDYEHYSIDDREIEDGEMVIYKRGRVILEIDNDGTLIVKGKKIDTSRDQRKMLRKYVEHYEFVIDQGIEIGLDGADIGITAAKEVFKAVFTFNVDKMEKRLEKMERKLEKKADALDEKAEELEYHAEEFVAIRCFLKREIDELADIDEF